VASLVEICAGEHPTSSRSGTCLRNSLLPASASFATFGRRARSRAAPRLRMTVLFKNGAPAGP
jgi:hypothetical protein